jgi:hypothetical protein
MEHAHTHTHTIIVTEQRGHTAPVIPSLIEQQADDYNDRHDIQ